MVGPLMIHISRRRLLRMQEVVKTAHAIADASGVVGNCNYTEYVADVKKATDSLDELGLPLVIK